MDDLPGDQAPGLCPPVITVWLAAGVEEALFHEATSHAPHETGGVLMGWSTGEDICVTNVIGPGPDATHERTSFLPDNKWQAEQIATLYERSGRRLSYLGDWHTHPGHQPVPSLRDRRTLRAIARHKAARCPRPVMAILGQPEGDTWVMRCHVHEGGRLQRRVQPQRAHVVSAPSLQGWDPR